MSWTEPLLSVGLAQSKGPREGMVLQTQLLLPHPLSDPAALSRCRLPSWSHLPGYIPAQEKQETELSSNTQKKCVTGVPAGPRHSLTLLYHQTNEIWLKHGIHEN